MSAMRPTLVAIARLAILAGLAACGGTPLVPSRLVVEADVGSWKFRRFQGPLLDIEVWVDGNKGEAYSASYITAASEQRGRIEPRDLVHVTVTKYQRDDGVIRETVKLVRRLGAEKGYQVNETKIAGVRALSIVGPSEMWVVWPAGPYVVKVGGQGRDSVPDKVVANYGKRYPSRLPGGSLEGPLPIEPGPTHEPAPYDPSNPKPDIERYDPKQVKLPKPSPSEPARR